jgi:hypothetical protein
MRLMSTAAALRARDAILYLCARHAKYLFVPWELGWKRAGTHVPTKVSFGTVFLN